MADRVANVFISYARRDRDRVRGLAAALEDEALSVWWDPNLVPGKRFRDIIARELSAADSVVVVWTAASVQSDYVQDEAEEARERGVLVPITLEPIKPPAGFRQVQAADLSQWTGSRQHPEFRMLLTAVRTLVEAARAAAESEGSAEPGAFAPEAKADEPAAVMADALAGSASRAATPPLASATLASTTRVQPTPPTERLETHFLPRLFDLFANPSVWLIGALLVALTGFYAGFGLSGVAAAMLLWAGAMAQAGLRLSPSRKTTTMVISLGVALIVGASAHDARGLVTATLVGGAVFAGVATIMVSTRGARSRPQRDATAREAYRRYWEQKIRSELGDERWRERRRRRARSDTARDG